MTRASTLLARNWYDMTTGLGWAGYCAGCQFCKACSLKISMDRNYVEVWYRPHSRA